MPGASRPAASGWRGLDNEWHALSLPQDSRRSSVRREPVARSQKPESSLWRHYLHKEVGPVQPVPILPDRPVVVRPDRALTLLPGQDALFFLEVPVWFRLCTTIPRVAQDLRGSDRGSYQDVVRGSRHRRALLWSCNPPSPGDRFRRSFRVRGRLPAVHHKRLGH